MHNAYQSLEVRSDATKAPGRGPEWVKLVVVLVVLLGLVDLILTLHAMTGAGMLEANPLARVLVRQGVAALVVFKLGAIGVNAAPLRVWRSRPIARFAAVASLMIMSWLMFRWTEWYVVWNQIGPDSWGVLTDDPRWVRISWIGTLDLAGTPPGRAPL